MKAGIGFLLAAVMLGACIWGGGCGIKRKLVQGVPDEARTLPAVSARYEAGPDVFGWLISGLSAKAFVLTLWNDSDTPLEGCGLVINRRYRCELAELTWYDPKRLETKPFRRPLPAHDQVSFHFDHDVWNHAGCRDDSGEAMPRSGLPERLELTCGSRTCTWQFNVPTW